MTTPLTPHLIEWLSLIRYQVTSAAELSRQPPPLGSMAINGFQDAVEAFLRLCTEHLHVRVAKQDFAHLFDSVDQDAMTAGRIGGHRAALLALNSARVGFKHHGNPPSAQVLERARVNSLQFLEDACQSLLGLDFNAISITAFIREPEARVLVENSRSIWASGDTDTALGNLRLALDRTVRDYEQRKVWAPGRSLFRTQPSFMTSIFDLKALGIEKLAEWIQAIDDRTKLLAFGVDLRRYAYFDAHAPRVVYFVNGGHQLQRRESVAITEDVFDRCLRFVIDTAVALGSDDYDFDAWSARRTDRDGKDWPPTN
jgi:hypothetical protein